MTHEKEDRTAPGRGVRDPRPSRGHDREEDETFGADRRGDEVPAELARRETRLQKMREAMKAIEAEAKERAGAKEAKNAELIGATTRRSPKRSSRQKTRRHRPQRPSATSPIPSRAS